MALSSGTPSNTVASNQAANAAETLFGNGPTPTTGQTGLEDTKTMVDLPASGPTVTPTTSQPVVTAGPAQASFTQHAGLLSNALNELGVNNAPKPQDTTGAAEANDPVITALGSLKTNNDQASNALISSTMAKYQNQINKAQSEGDNYKAGLQLMGIQHNESTFSPDLLSSHITAAANDTLTKINGLKAEESKALMDAQTAKANNDLKSLQDAMTRYKDIQTAKSQAIKDAYTATTNADKQLSVDGDTLYSTMKSLDPADQAKYIQAVAQKYGVSPMSVMSLLTQAHVKAASAEATLAKKNSSGSTTGSGSITKAEIATGEQKLNESKGPDGFVDPYVYQSAYQDWTSKGGTSKAFIAAFPPKDYVNPSATNLPKYLMPTVSGIISRNS